MADHLTRPTVINSESVNEFKPDEETKIEEGIIS